MIASEYRGEEILLREFTQVDLDQSALSEEEAWEIHNHYGKKIGIAWPSPHTNGKWRLTAKGYVGTLPLSSGRIVRIEPKTPISSIFAMLEYAFDIQLNVKDGLVTSDPIEELYSLLASFLARRVLTRGRQGLYRDYVPEEGELPYVRGRLDIRSSATHPWKVKPYCHYQEHTADVEENQILAWTLRTILRQGVCQGNTQQLVKAAWNMVGNLATPHSFSPSDCVNRLYSRLTEDYRPLHTLCRFFLEQSGPTHRVGDRDTIPFLIDMATLFETFVVRWLQKNGGEAYSFHPQYHVSVGPKGALSLYMDIVMRSQSSGKILAVIDTKYKAPKSVKNSDAYQIHAYAAHEGCADAVLIYPAPLRHPLDEQWGESGIRVRSLAFDLGGELEVEGRKMLASLYEKDC